jgi:hypothetical protein
MAKRSIVRVLLAAAVSLCVTAPIAGEPAIADKSTVAPTLGEDAGTVSVGDGPHSDQRKDAILHTFAPTTAAELSIRGNGPEARGSGLYAIVKPDGSAELRLDVRRNIQIQRRFRLDDAQREGLLKSVVEGLDEFQLETGKIWDASSLHLSLSAGTGSIAVKLEDAEHTRFGKRVAYYLNSILPESQRLQIGTHIPAPDASLFQQDQIKLRRANRRLSERALHFWDVSIRVITPAGKLFYAKIDKAGSATVWDNPDYGAPIRVLTRDINRQRTELCDLALRCIEQYALVLPRDPPPDVPKKTWSCELSLAVYAEFSGTIFKTSSVDIKELDFEWNKVYYKNVNSFLQALRETPEK